MGLDLLDKLVAYLPIILIFCLTHKLIFKPAFGALGRTFQSISNHNNFIFFAELFILFFAAFLIYQSRNHDTISINSAILTIILVFIPLLVLSYLIYYFFLKKSNQNKIDLSV